MVVEIVEAHILGAEQDKICDEETIEGKVVRMPTRLDWMGLGDVISIARTRFSSYSSSFDRERYTIWRFGTKLQKL